MTINPLLAEAGLPKFGDIKVEHIKPALDQVLVDSERELSELEEKNAREWSDFMPAIDRIHRRLHRAWGPVSHLLGTMNNDALRKVYEELQPKIVNFGLRFSQSEKIYALFKSLQTNKEVWNKLERAQQRIIETNIRDAEFSGIALKGKDRERFNEISQKLSQLSTKFSNNVLDATKAFAMVITNPDEVEGIPESARALASQSYNAEAEKENKPKGDSKTGPWRFTLDGPSLLAFLQHGRNRKRREEIYRANLTKASSGQFDNTEIAFEILQLRKEKAKLLGFDSFAELSVARKMARKVAAVEKLSKELLQASLGPAKEEFAEIEAFAKRNGHTGALAHWDVSFWSERLREDKFKFTDEDIKPYFALPKVLEGLFALVEKVFAVQVKAADGEAPVWHKDVRFFNISTEDNQHIASFYLDPYSRPENKRGGAWMDDCIGRERFESGLQLPVAYLVCNSTPPIGVEPSLMTFREVETLFHEFGHGLQHMLTKVDFAQAAGINNVEWDAVELPSQFMENWCYHENTAMKMARHFKTGKSIPKELFEKIKASRNFMAASMMLRQLRFGMTDMELHHRFDGTTSDSIFSVAAKVAEQTAVIPPLKEDRMLCSFSHIFAGGYAAGYYSYKWAEVLSADAFSAFEEAGLDDHDAVKTTGKRFADTILALGGSEHPMEVFKAFRGREPKIDALLRHSGLRHT